MINEKFRPYGRLCQLRDDAYKERHCENGAAAECMSHMYLAACLSIFTVCLHV